MESRVLAFHACHDVEANRVDRMDLPVLEVGTCKFTGAGKLLLHEY